MSQTQLKRAHILRNYNEGVLSRKATAEKLQISERQVTRLAKGMKEQGEAALIHKNTGRKPVHTISPQMKAEVLEIRSRDIYQSCNTSHFQELLGRKHGIKLSYNSVYSILKEGEIQSPKKHRNKTKHRRRKRKAQAGDLIQIDATPYDWFDDGNLLALHGGIDDATGQITGLYLTKNECLQGYFEIARQTCLDFGIPLSMYSDKHTIFRSPLTDKKKEIGEEANLTQFGRALEELGVNIIHANSPQAKGRIERLWETLQSRLPIELSIMGITTIEAANEFLHDIFIPIFNERFSVEAEGNSIFVPYVHREGIGNIDNILCVKETRKADAAGIVSFRGKRFKILDEGYPLVPTGGIVEVLTGTRIGIKVRYKGRLYEAEIAEEMIRTAVKGVKGAKDRPTSVPKVIRDYVKPHLIHSGDEWKKIWHAERYEETLAFLYDTFFKRCA